MLLLPPRLAIGWIVAFFAGGALLYAVQQGQIGAIYFLFYAAAYTFCAVFGYTLRQAEAARRQNEQLLVELRQTQDRLQALAVAEERNRMARDLHDSTKQQAFALAAQLDAVRSLMPRDPALAQEHLHQAVAIADNLRQELAAMILDLRPPRLVSVGLSQLINNYTKDWSRQNAIPVTTTIEGEGSLLAASEEALFRIAQEALANVARHSQATSVDLRLIYLPQQVTLTIQDDGCGFDPYQSSPGLGQQTMRERAAALPHGSLKINSKPGCGATVTVRCDL
jgi:NarL family two-component system sensor histidine kinase LiaS